MKQQYYTPSLEDFFVGYECEQRDPDFQGQSDGKEWKPYYMTPGKLASAVENWNYFQDYRTASLTQQQLEAEGWNLTYRSSSCNQFVWMLKGDFYLKLYTEGGKVLLARNRNGDLSLTLFDGLCPSMNEVRRACKMVGVH